MATGANNVGYNRQRSPVVWRRTNNQGRGELIDEKGSTGRTDSNTPYREERWETKKEKESELEEGVRRGASEESEDLKITVRGVCTVTCTKESHEIETFQAMGFTVSSLERQMDGFYTILALPDRLRQGSSHLFGMVLWCVACLYARYSGR